MANDIPMFGGYAGEDVKIWIMRAKIKGARVFNHTKEELANFAKTTVITDVLTKNSPAFHYVHDLSDEVRGDFNKLCDALKDRFKHTEPERDFTTLLNAFGFLKQESGENINSSIDRARVIYNGLDSSYKVTVHKKFADGISDKVLKSLYKFKINDLREQGKEATFTAVATSLGHSEASTALM